jgi:aldehyde dehydrogenase (NAD+)
MLPPQLNSLSDYFHSGAILSCQYRKQQLKLFKNVLLKYQKEIEAALYADLKKSPEEAWATETGLLMQEINYALKNLHNWMKPVKPGTNLLNFPSASYIYPSPKGVVLIIGTWNFPLQLLLIPFVGAIAAGNCVVLKPSEHAPATAALIEKMIKEIFPEKYVSVVQGSGVEVIPSLMSSFRFDHIFYTGSTFVGKMIYQAAAKDLVPVTLELGGKAPCIVEEDADLKVAARRITVSKFVNAGQVCVSPDYILVHESRKEKLVELIKENIQKFYGNDPSENYNYGKIINERQFERLISYLKDGKIITGGKHDKSKLFIEPTLLDDVSMDSSVMKEEIFGPILPVFTFNTIEDAKKIILQNPDPLSFYLFTKSRKKQEEWIQQFRFGNGCINNAAWQFTNHHLPFGGVGNSGIGGYHGKYSFDTFTHFKSLMKTPNWFDPAVKYPPLKGKLKLFKWLIR